MTRFEIIVAADREMGIGKAGQLPWRLPGDVRHFKNVTTRSLANGHRNAVIMGRRTWESIPPSYRPLKSRLNLVVTRDPRIEVDPSVLVAGSLPEALARAAAAPDVRRIFLIGGGTLYREGLQMRECRRVHITRVDGQFECDTFFPPLGEDFELVSASDPITENGVDYRFEVYERRS